MRSALTLGCCLTLAGCAALLNSNRPDYNGPIVKPAWHNSSIRVDRPAVIHNGGVYVVARPFADPGSRRIFAFDLKNGQPLWTTSFPAEKILLATDPILFVEDDGGKMHAVDRKTGKDLAPALLSFQSGTLADGILYTASGISIEARSLDSYQADIKRGSQLSKPLWHIDLLIQPMLSLPPVVANGTVYIAAFSKFQVTPLKRAESGFYAIDSKTGALRWKWESREQKGAPLIQGFSADASAAYVWAVDHRDSQFGVGVLTSFDASMGKESWKYKAARYVSSCPGPLLIDPNTVLMCDYPPGNGGAADEAGYLFRRLNRQTGAKVSEVQTPWKYKETAVSNGVLYASDRKVHQLINENNNTSPDSWVTAVSLSNGKELWRSEIIELGVLTAPAAGGGMVVVGSEPFTFNTIAGKPEVAGLWAYSIGH